MTPFAAKPTPFKQEAMRSIGRYLQIIALALTPLSMLLPKAEKFTFPGPTLTMLLGMVCLFGIGRLVEGYAR